MALNLSPLKLLSIALPLVTLFAHPVIADVTVPVQKILPDLHDTQIPVLLPDRLPFDSDSPLYFNSTAASDSYEVSFEYTPDCRQATPCYLGSLSAQQNGEPIDTTLEGTQEVRTIELSDGTAATFVNFCGAYCMARLEWQAEDVVYTVTIKNGEESDLVEIANVAIEAGVR
ncbi:MAG TPA: hypothetical protein V6D10_00910 [Trichocoleus sp.]|jgi:hypothetical protein